jgi:hypothetical protein
MKPFLLAVPLLLSACSAPKPAEKPVNKPASELTAKLKAMPPEQRKEYLRQHPAEVQAAMNGMGGAMPKPR